MVVSWYHRPVRRLRFALCILFLLAPAAQAKECLPEVRDGWIRLLPGGMPMHAGFGHIVNACRQPVAIVGARSDAYAEVELHETRVVEGVSRMRPVPRLALAARDGAELRPGGLHLMLMRPASRIEPGQRIVIEFRLADGRRIRGEFVARTP